MTSFHEIFGTFVKTEKLTETSTVAAESTDNTETISVDLGKFGFYILTNELSFYRSQNVLGWSNIICQTKKFSTYCISDKIFMPDKKKICIQSNWFICHYKSFLRGTKCSQIFGLVQKICTDTKHFGTCKRTTRKYPDEFLQ